MVINLTVPAYMIKNNTTYLMDGSEFSNLDKFPILVIDKDSYIVGSKVWCNLDSCKDFWGYNFQVGQHSSLAEDIEFIINLNKDYHKTAMGIITGVEYKGPRESNIKLKGQIIIQNDCWIGHGATIMSGVTIRNGAIVGAGAVVTKDVPAYAIVAGNPAKIVGFRFEPEEIEALQKIAWWDWSAEKKAENIELLRSNPKLLIKKHLKEAEERIQREFNKPSPVSNMAEGVKKYSFKVDMDKSYAICPFVIKSFCEYFDNKNAQLVLFIPYETPNREAVMNQLIQELDKYQEKTCFIQIIDEEGVTLEDIIRNTDYFITSRDNEMVHASYFVDLYGKTLISGVDSPLFP